MLQYKLVFASDMRKLQRDVQEHLDAGFSLQGGASSNGRVFTQAVVIEGDELPDVAEMKRRAEMEKVHAMKAEREAKAAAKAAADKAAADEAAANEAAAKVTTDDKVVPEDEAE